MILLDAGHGENTPGKRSPAYPRDSGSIREGQSFREHSFNRSVVNLLDIQLRAAGYKVKIVNPELWDVSLGERVRRINQVAQTNDLLLSIHADAYSPSYPPVWNSANGVTTYHYNKTRVSDKVAAVFHPQFQRATQRRDRGVKGGNFMILRETHCRALLLEGGFMTHWEECQLLDSPNYQMQVSTGILRGIQALKLTPHYGSSTVVYTAL